MKRPSRTLPTLATAAAITLAATAPLASAQPNEPIHPPKVEEPAKAPTWLYYLVSVGAIAITVGLAVFPSRRSHED